MALDAWFAVAVFLLGAACGTLLPRIAYGGWKIDCGTVWRSTRLLRPRVSTSKRQS